MCCWSMGGVFGEVAQGERPPLDLRMRRQNVADMASGHAQYQVRSVHHPSAQNPALLVTHIHIAGRQNVDHVRIRGQTRRHEARGGYGDGRRPPVAFQSHETGSQRRAADVCGTDEQHAETRVERSRWPRPIFVTTH